jgi:hypothetical protein
MKMKVDGKDGKQVEVKVESDDNNPLNPNDAMEVKNEFDKPL